MTRDEVKARAESLQGIFVTEVNPLISTINISNAGVPYFPFKDLVYELWENGRKFKRGISFSGKLDITVPQAEKLIKELQDAVKKLKDFDKGVVEYFEKEKEK